LYAKVAAIKIGLQHFLHLWLSLLQRVQRFSFFRFSTTSSLSPSYAFFQSVCSSFTLLLFLFLTVLFCGASHRHDPFAALLSGRFFIFGLQPWSDSSGLRLGGGAWGVVSDFDNFPLSRSFSSCLPTFVKISIYCSLMANEK